MLSHCLASMSLFRLLLTRGTLMPQRFHGSCDQSLTFLSHYLFLSSQYGQLHLGLPGLYSKRFKFCLVEQMSKPLSVELSSFLQGFCKSVSFAKLVGISGRNTLYGLMLKNFSDKFEGSSLVRLVSQRTGHGKSEFKLTVAVTKEGRKVDIISISIRI